MSSGQAGVARELLAVEDTEPFQLAVRAGFLARGLTYALIGAIAIALAVGAGTGAAPNQQGALSLVARAPLGGVALGLIAAGLGAYALWKLALAVFGAGPEGAGSRKAFDRVSNLAAAVVYGAFCALAVRVLAGDAGNQTAQQRRTASGVLGWPGGREIVAAVGAVLLAICAHQVRDGVTGRFARDSKTSEMGAREKHAFLLLGRIGIVARALVFGLSGYFLIRSAIDFRVGGVGLDGTLANVHHQPYGNVLLVLAGAGLGLFAAFSVLEARRRRL
jgi:hypothetical protein